MNDLQSKTDEELNVMLAPLADPEFWTPEQLLLAAKLAEATARYRALQRRDSFSGLSIERELENLENADAVLVPRYCSSLDEVAKVEAGLTENQKGDFINALCRVVHSDRSKPGTAMFKAFFATARQRTIALIQTLTP